jgi:nitroreductase
MELFEAINQRRSVRRFKSEQISESDLVRILEAAVSAPSAGNLQPWRFIIVRDAQRKIALAEAALGQSMVSQAPIVVVVCADQRRSGRYYGERGVNLFCIQDTAAAVQNLMLAAFALGLGTCWVGSFDEKKVSSILHAQNGARPVAIVPVGYPAEDPTRTARRPLSEVVQEETLSS